MTFFTLVVVCFGATEFVLGLGFVRVRIVGAVGVGDGCLLVVGGLVVPGG